MGKTIQKVGGFAVGILLFFLGFSLLQPTEGIVHTGITTALAAVLTALGIGIIAAAALPNELEVSGEQFKPLGLNVKASGGAAVFLVTLGFIFYMKDVKGAEVAQPQQQQAESGTNPPPASQTTAQDTEVALEGEDGQPVPIASATAAPPPASFPQLQQQTAPMSANYYLAWTYCSACCPDGPDYCQQVGIGEGLNPQDAGLMAAQQCVLNGGHEDTCISNVQYLSAEDWPY